MVKLRLNIGYVWIVSNFLESLKNEGDEWMVVGETGMKWGETHKREQEKSGNMLSMNSYERAEENVEGFVIRWLTLVEMSVADDEVTGKCVWYLM